MAAIGVSRPGATLPEIHAKAVRVLCEGMVSLGILKGSVDEIIEKETYRRCYMHGTSHWLGLDVHDVGAYVKHQKAEHQDAKQKGARESKLKSTETDTLQPRPLEPGMSFTIEPGLYLGVNDAEVPEAFRGIGIRIEDDIVVTKSGILNLNERIPKKVDEIEAWVLAEN